MREDWIESSLGKVCKITLGQSPSSADCNNQKIGLPFFQGKAEFTKKYPIPRVWCAKPKKIANADSILLSVRAPVGSTNVAFEKCGIGRGLAALEYNLCQDFILFYLKAIEQELDSKGTGTTFKAISGDILRDQKILLPPLPEQRAIVKKIEQLFSALDASIADLKKAQGQLKIYRQAVLKKAFKDVKKTIQLSEVGTWKGGGTPSTQKKGFWDDGNIPWVSSQDVKSMYINNTERKITNIAIENSSTKWIDKGALLFVVRSGILRRIFPIAIANVDLCVNQDIQTVTLKSNFIPEFLYWFLTGNEFEIRHSCAKDGTTVESIDVYKLKNYDVPSCSIKQQRQIIKEIESRLSVCDAVEQQIKTSLDKAEALRQSILKKAFAGALLTQAELEACRKEPDYEPASVLLEKIKAEKQTDKKKLEKEKVATKAKPVKVVTGKISTDIQAGLIAKVIRLHEENPKHHTLLTHVKCEKLSHLVEYHLQIPLGRQPVKDAAGPDDYPRLKKVEHRAKMAGYFSVQKNKIGHTYISGKGIGKAITQFEKNLSEGQKQRVDQLLHLFLTFDLEQAEIVATVYAAWNNLLILGKKKPTNQEIVQEARYNWSDRKLGLEEYRFYKAIEWMQKDTVNLVPTGYGTLVDFPKKKK